MDTENLGERIERLEHAVHSPRGYTGAENKAEVADYLRDIFKELSPIVYEGLDSPHRDAQNLGRFTDYVMRKYDWRKDKAIDDLRSGNTYTELLEGLLKDRLVSEVGERYVNKALKLDMKITLNVNSHANVGIATESYGQHHVDQSIFFSPRGIVIMDKKLKEAGLAHEAAHLALGHANPKFHPPADRRKLEFDAHYVGCLIHGKPEEYKDLIRFSEALEQLNPRSGAVDIEGHLLKRQEQHSARLETYPVPDEWRKRLDDERHHAEYAAGVIYPTAADNLAEMERRLQERDSQDKPRRGLRQKAAAIIRRGDPAAELRQVIKDLRVDQVQRGG